ncbi:Exocyst complex component 1 [Liparis tanakae]|uniref:Exocyst complex component 1 n=1 Tax=Liparis tanakae TaxID=230148 RepID=A0A4Z2E144_9TELE|nr:Exocyst complex component 1 [Liparis tanakae]
MSRLYEREIKDFFEVAKIKMAGASKEAKGKFGKPPTFDPRPRSTFTSLSGPSGTTGSPSLSFSHFSLCPPEFSSCQ